MKDNRYVPVSSNWVRGDEGEGRYQTYEDRSGPVGTPERLKSFIKRRRRIMLLGLLTVLATVLAATLLMPRTYESAATFLIEDQERTAMPPALSILERSGRLANQETEMALIRSRRVVAPIVDSEDLHVSLEGPTGPVRPAEAFAAFEAGPDAVEGEYEIYREAAGRWTVEDRETGARIATGQPNLPMSFAGVEIRISDTDEGPDGRFKLRITPFPRAVGAVQQRIKVSPVHRDADLVRVTCTGKSAFQAQSLCTSITDGYLALRSELKHAEAAAAAEFLDSQTEIIATRLSEAEDSLRAYSKREQAVDLGTQASEGVRQYAALWAQREQLRAERASLSALISRVDSADDGSRNFRDLASFPTFLDSRNQTVPSLLATLISLENQRNELSVRRSERDAEVMALNSRIAEVEGQLRSLAISYEQALATQIASLDLALANSGAVLSNIPSQQIETARLEREVNVLDDLHGFLQTRLQEAQIAEAIELPIVRVVDQAYLPFKHSAPNERLNLAMGLLLGSGFGFLLGLWQEVTDTRYRERIEVEEDTGFPVLSMVPRLRVTRQLGVRRKSLSDGSSALLIRAAGNQDAELVVEAFRTLSVDLGFVGRRSVEGGFRSIAVTSSTRGEGKTFTCCNLATVKARSGLRTLLIDGDVRGQGVSRFFSLSRDVRGLTDVLSNGFSAPEAIAGIQETEPGSNLFILPAGYDIANSGELLSGEHFRTLVDLAARTFDFVVVDTPPLNVVSDAASIAVQADGVLVVVRTGVTDRAALDLTLDRLGRSGATVAGIVLNDAELSEAYRTYSYRPSGDTLVSGR